MPAEDDGEVAQLHYTDIDDWKEWHADLANDLSVIVPKGATGDVTVTVGVHDAE